MGECDCQCQCDLILLVEDRVRSEYDPSENDADEGYRTGYATAVAEFAAGQSSSGLLGLGRTLALMDAGTAIAALGVDDCGCGAAAQALAAVRALGQGAG